MLLLAFECFFSYTKIVPFTFFVVRRSLFFLPRTYVHTTEMLCKCVSNIIWCMAQFSSVWFGSFRFRVVEFAQCVKLNVNG